MREGLGDCDTCWPSEVNHVSDTRVERSALVSLRVTVWTDGYADADGAGWAFVARGAREAQASGALPPTPSHLAEWTAALRALAWAEATLEAGEELHVRTDSALVAKGLASRRPRMTGDAAEMRAEARRILARLGERGVRANVQRVPREENAEADGLARAAALAHR